MRQITFGNNTLTNNFVSSLYIIVMHYVNVVLTLTIGAQ